MTGQPFKTFKEFYPYYLQEHQQPLCRALHYCGSTLVLIILAYAIFSTEWSWLWLMPVAGYGFAWVGHFFVEHNKPATFKYPFYSLLGDWVMYAEFLSGRLQARLAPSDPKGR
jgi:hypothetical protein